MCRPAGRLALEFAREAADAGTAVHSALTDVRSAVPLAKLIEVAPDLAGLTDVADIVGVSRQSMRKLMLKSSLQVAAHDVLEMREREVIALTLGLQWKAQAQVDEHYMLAVARQRV